MWSKKFYIKGEEKIKPKGQTLGDHIYIIPNQNSFSKLQEATFGQAGVMLQ